MGNVADIVKEFEILVGQRVNWDTQWQRVQDIAWPDSGQFTSFSAPGSNRYTQIYDATNTLALEKFGAVLESLLTPRQNRFQTLRPSNPDLMKERDAALYFEELTNRLFMLRNRPRSGFYDQFFESHKSLGGYGNQCMHVVPSRDRTGISYRNVHIGAVWIELDDRGVIDTIFYKFKLSAKAAIQRWGEQAPKCAREAVEQKNSYKSLEFLHVVKPRDLIMPGLLGSKSMPWESWEISLDDKEFIRIKNPLSGQLEESGGFFTNPYIYSRFSTNSSEKHGRGPAMFVLADNESLQRMERSSLLYGEHAVTPALLAMNNDLLSDNSTNLDMRPAAVNPGWLDAMGRERVKPLLNGFNFQVSEALMQKKRDVIADAHFITLFQILVETPEMTATEALIRAQEKGQLIAPMVGRQQGESLGPLVERELSIMADLELLPEMPQVLLEAAGEYEIEYASSATRIQREEEVQGIRATFADLAGIAEVDPTVVEVMDAPGAVRFIAKARNVPSHLIRNEREFNKIVDAQAKAAERQKQMEMIPPMAGAAKDAAAAGIEIAPAA